MKLFKSHSNIGYLSEQIENIENQISEYDDKVTDLKANISDINESMIANKNTVEYLYELKETFEKYEEISDEVHVLSSDYDKYITNTFFTQSNVEVKSLFTKDKSQIDFTKNNESELFSDFEKNYFVGVGKTSIFSNANENNQNSMSDSDKVLLEGYINHRTEVIRLGIKVYGLTNLHGKTRANHN